MTATPLLDWQPYNGSPGFKEPTTSREAAEAMKVRAVTLRAGVMQCLKANPAGLTADECAAMMGETVLAVRPRLSELSRPTKDRLALIIPTGTKRENASGLMAKVWCIR